MAKPPMGSLQAALVWLTARGHRVKLHLPNPVKGRPWRPTWTASIDGGPTAESASSTTAIRAAYRKRPRI